MSLTDTERDRYRRQLLLAEIGGQGQQALKKASVLVVGAGGLGCPILMNLAAAGVGRLGICDGDTIEMSNLNRQFLYTPDDIGKPKADMAAAWVARFNPLVEMIPHTEPMGPATVAEIISGYDFIIEGVDRYAPRFDLNEACLVAKKPWISSAVGRMTGQVMLFDPREDASPCYRCFVPEAPTDEALCEAEGVVGTTVAITGSLAANETVKYLCDIDPVLTNSILVYDGKSGTTRRIALSRDPACPSCSRS